MTVQDLRERITDTEFLNWQAFFYLRDRKHTKQDYYLAAIAHRIHVANGGKGNLEKFLLQYKEPQKAPDNPQLHEEMWLALASGNPKPQLQTGEAING